MMLYNLNFSGGRSTHLFKLGKKILSDHCMFASRTDVHIPLPVEGAAQTFLLGWVIRLNAQPQLNLSFVVV